MNTVTTTRRYAELGLHALVAGCIVIKRLGPAVEVTLIVAGFVASPEAIVVGLFVGEPLLIDSVDNVDWYWYWLWLELEVVGRVLLFRFLLLRLLLMGFSVDILLMAFVGW
jgi:hypothetical protein